MTKNEETADQAISVRLTKLEVKILNTLGGPTAFIKSQIQEKAGDKLKLLQLKQQVLDRIDTDQKQIKDIDKLILEMESRAEEEAKRKREQDKMKQISEKPRARVETTINKEKWLASIKPTLLDHLNNGGISEGNYETVRLYKGFKTNDEVDAWVREPETEAPIEMKVNRKREEIL